MFSLLADNAIKRYVTPIASNRAISRSFCQSFHASFTRIAISMKTK